MKKGSTIFLKGVVFLIAIAVLALCIFGLPPFIRNVVEFIGLPVLEYPILIVLYLTALLFFTGLFQALKLLSCIDKNIAFSEISVTALSRIKYSAVGMSILYWILMPVIFLMADKDDAPGLIIVGAILSSAPIVVAVFAAVLQKLVRKALDIKSENDLTV